MSERRVRGPIVGRGGWMLALVGLLLAGASGAARGGGPALLPIIGVREVVFDPHRDLLYVSTSRGTIERYDHAAGVMLEPFKGAGTSFNGIDMTPDGAFILVADESAGLTSGAIRMIDPDTGAFANAFYPRSGLEAGAHDVAATATGFALLSTGFSGSGHTPIRRVEIETGVLSIANPSVHQNASLSRSADGMTVLLGTNGVSPSTVMIYDVATEAFISTMGSAASNGAAVSPDGALVAAYVNSAGRMSLLNRQLELVGPLGVQEWGSAAFCPLGRLVYVTDTALDHLVAFDVNTLQEVGRYLIGENVSGGNIAISADGDAVFYTTPTGVRVIPVDPGAGASMFLPLAVFARRGSRGRRRASGWAAMAAAASLLAAHVAPAFADGALIPVPERRDHVFDDARGALYISTSTGVVERWDAATGALLTPLQFGSVALNDIDITPDGARLYIADGTHRSGQAIVWVVTLETGAAEQVLFQPAATSARAHYLQVTNADHALVSVLGNASGDIAIYRINFGPPHTVASAIAVRPGSPIFRGADRRTLFYSEQVSSGTGNIGVYDAPSRTFIAEHNTGQSVGGIGGAVDRHGERIVGLRSQLGSVLTRTLAPVELVGDASAGVGYSPVADVLYVVSGDTDEVVARDALTFREVRRFPVGENVTGTTSLDLGAMSFSGDGRLLFLSTAMGVRVFDVGEDVACAGDANGDGFVDFADLNIVVAQFLQSGPSLAGDLDGDGTVTFADLNLVLSAFNSSCR